MRKGGGASELDDSAGSDLPPGLKAMRNENVLLTLPGNYKVSTSDGAHLPHDIKKERIAFAWQGQRVGNTKQFVVLISVSDTVLNFIAQMVPLL